MGDQNGRRVETNRRRDRERRTEDIRHVRILLSRLGPSLLKYADFPETKRKTEGVSFLERTRSKQGKSEDERVPIVPRGDILVLLLTP